MIRGLVSPWRGLTAVERVASRIGWGERVIVPDAPKRCPGRARTGRAIGLSFDPRSGVVALPISPDHPVNAYAAAKAHALSEGVDLGQPSTVWIDRRSWGFPYSSGSDDDPLTRHEIYIDWIGVISLPTLDPTIGEVTDDFWPIVYRPHLVNPFAICTPSIVTLDNEFALAKMTALVFEV